MYILDDNLKKIIYLFFWSLKIANNDLAHFCGNLNIVDMLSECYKINELYVTSHCISVYETHHRRRRRHCSGRIVHFEATIRNSRYVSGIPEFLAQRQTRVSAILVIFYSFIRKFWFFTDRIWQRYE